MARNAYDGTTLDDETEFEDEDLTVETDEDTETVRKLRKALKSQSRTNKQLTNENGDLKKNLTKYQRKELISQAGLDDLNEVQRQAIFRTHAEDQEVTKESVVAQAQQLGYLAPDTTNEELNVHEEITNASVQGGQAQTAVITPADAAEWDEGRRQSFRSKYPEKFEALKRGEQVKAVDF